MPYINIFNFTNMKKEKNEIEVKKISLPIVDKLEELSKCGFYCESKEDPSVLEPLVRLCAEGKPAIPEENIPEDPAIELTPWCTVSNLTLMLQGVLYLHPMVAKVVKDHNGNASKPQGE